MLPLGSIGSPPGPGSAVAILVALVSNHFLQIAENVSVHGIDPPQVILMDEPVNVLMARRRCG